MSHDLSNTFHTIVRMTDIEAARWINALLMPTPQDPCGHSFAITTDCPPGQRNVHVTPGALERARDMGLLEHKKEMRG